MRCPTFDPFLWKMLWENPFVYLWACPESGKNTRRNQISVFFFVELLSWLDEEKWLAATLRTYTSSLNSSPNPLASLVPSKPFLWWKKRGWCRCTLKCGNFTGFGRIPQVLPRGGRAPLPIRSSGVPLLSVLVASSDLFLKVELVIPAPTKGIQLGASPLLASIYALRSSYWAA